VAPDTVALGAALVDARGDDGGVVIGTQATTSARTATRLAALTWIHRTGRSERTVLSLRYRV
jgi:hypothetical protein